MVPAQQYTGELVMNAKQLCGVIVVLYVAAVAAPRGLFGIEEWDSDQGWPAS